MSEREIGANVTAVKDGDRHKEIMARLNQLRIGLIILTAAIGIMFGIILVR